MTLAETQQLRMLDRLRRAGKQPVTLGELRSGGIHLPAVVIGELELHGYAIERVYEHGPADRRTPARHESLRSALTPASPMAPTFAIASDGVREFAGALLLTARPPKHRRRS